MMYELSLNRIQPNSEFNNCMSEAALNSAFSWQLYIICCSLHSYIIHTAVSNWEIELPSYKRQALTVWAREPQLHVC